MARNKSKAGSQTAWQKQALDLPAGYRAHSYVRFRDNGGITLAPIDTGLGWNFAFNQIADYTDFTSLYDGYVIEKIEMRFVLFNNVAEKYPVLIVAPDYDDAGAPTSENDLLSMEQVRVLPFSPDQREHKITVKPRVSQTLYRTGVTSAYGWGKSRQIVDMANVDTPHPGVRHWLVNYNSTDTPGAVVRVFIKYHFSGIGQR